MDSIRVSEAPDTGSIPVEATCYLHSLIKPGLGEQQWIPLPSFLHGLYYLIRPIRILLRGKEE
jgi:hypothetical protein